MIKRLVFLPLVLVFLLGVASAEILVNLEDSYLKKETVIVEIGGNVLSPISSSQMSIKKNGHIDVGFTGGVKRVGSKNYVWFNAPQNPGSYTLVLENVVTTVNGFVQQIDYEKNFNVGQDRVDYSISPGAISTASDFEVTATLYDSFSKDISVSFPEERTISLIPGNRKIYFSIDEVFGEQAVMINIGRYSVPAYIFGGQAPEPEEEPGSGGEMEDDVEADMEEEVDEEENGGETEQPTSPEEEQEEVNLCGNGFLDGGEDCDSFNLDGMMCYHLGFSSGDLICTSNCIFDVSECVISQSPAREDEKSGSGGEMEDDVEADMEEEVDEEEDIDDENIEQEKQCIPETFRCEDNSLIIIKECLDGELVESDNECPEVDGGRTRLEVIRGFAFSPRMINSTLLIDDASSQGYIFEIVNNGDEPITSLDLDYDESIFVITAEEGRVIEPNSSLRFNLRLRESDGRQVRELVSATSGSEESYMLVQIGFTRDPDNVETNYLDRIDSPSSSLFYCSELDGIFCSADEVCSGEVSDSIDGSACCLARCERPGGNSKAWIGYLIAAILIAVLAIIYFRYKKTGPGGNPMMRRASPPFRRVP